MTQQTTADALIAQLAAAGVKRLYGVIGDAIFPLASALDKQTEVQFIAAIHETNAAYMASYEAKLTGRITACMATSGPGATNLATGLADAYTDGAPVVAITGQVASGNIATGAKQYFDQQTFFKPITVSSTMAVAPEAALHAVTAALHRSVVHQTATHVAIPKDVLARPVAWTALPMELAPPTAAGVVGDVEAAADRLRNAQRPLVIIGVHDADVVADALELADMLGAAVVAAQHCKGAVPHDHPRLIGGVGAAHVPTMVEACDVLLLIGDAPYEIPFIPPETAAVVISPTVRLPMQHPLIAGFIGDVASGLADLAQRLTKGGFIDRHEWQQQIAAARDAKKKQVETLPLPSRNEACNPYALAVALGRHVPPDAVIAVDIGAFSHWFDLGFPVQHHAVLTSPRWRGIGAALPAAIAAGLATPQRQAIAIVGDGALLPTLGELCTAVRYRLPLLIVVVNNGTYDVEKQKMAHSGFSTLGTPLPTLDFAALARACGAAGLSVHTSDQLDGVLAEAMGLLDETRDRPVLVDVKTTMPALPHIGGA